VSDAVAELLAAYAATAERWHDLLAEGDDLHAIAAEHALTEFRAGTLDLDD
jgi:hypothetical protein